MIENTKLRTMLCGAAIILTASTALLSCGKKEVSRDEAVKFVNEHYKKTEAKTPSKIHAKWDFSSAEGTTLASTFFKSLVSIFTEEEVKNVKLKDEKDIAVYPIEPITAEDLPIKVGYLDYKFYIGGDALTVKEIATSDDSSMIVRAAEDRDYNKDGYLAKIYSKHDKIKFPNEKEANGYLEIVYTYAN